MKNESLKGNPMQTDRYTLNTYIFPFWSGDCIYLESFFPLCGILSEISAIPLMCEADRILEVCSSDLKRVYIQGKDYVLEDGKILIPQGSEIQGVEYKEFYMQNENPGASFERTGGGYTVFHEGGYFHERQLAVTYRYKGGWYGPVPYAQGEKLPKLQKKLENRQKVRIVYYGDSITEGANSSGCIHTEPFAPGWTDMFSEYLRNNYGTYTETFNTAVGGEISKWGLENLSERVIEKNPDLAVIAFGMNDGTHGVSADMFKFNIEEIIKKIKKVCPECEIILISPMLPNPDVKGFLGTQVEYAEKLCDLSEAFDGVAFANVTEMYQFIVSKKRYCDITGNNVNHPNDFIARLYAQILVMTIQK